MTIYLIAWLTACVTALVLYVREREAHLISRPAYWRFIAVPWKAATFAIAAGAMVAMAPYTGDPTWDYVDAAFMSVLCYATAPWAVGVAYRAVKGKAHWREIYVMVCAWMFSVSWSYDGYILIKTGVYPLTWLSNIALSSVLYISAGMLWNLEHQPGRGVSFGFLRADWPQSLSGGRFSQVAWFALPFMVLAAGLTLAFVVLYFR